MPTPTKIVFLILPQVHLLDLAGPDQVFFEAIDHGAAIEIAYCSYTENLNTSAGLPFGKLQHFDQIDLKPGDFILVPGADLNYLYSTGLGAQVHLFQWMREAHAGAVNICSICTGAFLLALTGLLDGKNCTTHWKRTAELQRKFPALKVAENVLFVEDDGIYTSAGVASGIDMSLHILAQLKGEYFTHQVARELVIYNRRRGNQSQHSVLLDYRNHIHTGIHTVQDWLQENLHHKTSLLALSEIACMSSRNFTRVFKKETGITVNEYITLLRKEKIRELIQKPDLSRGQIASHCGLRSERHLSRIIHS